MAEVSRPKPQVATRGAESPGRTKTCAPPVASLETSRYVQVLSAGWESLVERLFRVAPELVHTASAELHKPQIGLRRRVRTRLIRRPTPLGIALFLLENAA